MQIASIWRRCLFLPLLVFCSTIALMACGGGGDNDSAPAPTPLLPLNTNNSTTSVATVFSLSSVGDYLGWQGFNAYLTASYSNILPQETPCPLGGSVRTALIDNDRSQGLTVNDRITLTYTACKFTGGTLDAQLDVDLLQQQGSFVSAQQVSPLAYDARVVYRVVVVRYSQSDDQNLFTVNGAVDAEFEFNATQDHFITTVDRIGTLLSRGAQSQTVTLRNYRKDHLLDYSLSTYRMSMNGEAHIEAGSLLGYFSFDTGTDPTATPLAGTMNRYPDSGKLTLRGANNSYLRLEARSAGGAAPIYAALFLSPTTAGGAEQETQIAWSSIVPVTLFEPLRVGFGSSSRTQTQGLPTVDATHFPAPDAQ